MICRDGCPTELVGRAGFKNVINTMDPRYTLPTPNTFSRSIIPKLKEDVDAFQMKKIESMLKNEVSMAFTTDGLDCHDVNKSAVYSFTIHYYEKDKLCSEVLFVRNLSAPVTGDVIKDFIKQCLTDIKVLDTEGRPKLAIWGVTDQGSNIVRALKLLKEEGTIAGYHHCFGHNLQNVIKDAIKTTPGMEKTLDKFKANAAILSRSKNERTAFRKICKTNHVPEIIPPVPNATRWFGLLKMLEGFLKVEKGMKLHIATSNAMEPLSASDWKNAHGFVEILKPFHSATRIEEGENYLTLSSIIPVLSILHAKTTSYYKNRHHNGFGIIFARNMLASVEDRFGTYPDFLTMRPHCLATISDPRFSWIYFQKKPELEPVRETVIDWAKDEIEILKSNDEPKTPDAPSSDTSETDSFWGTFDQQLGKTQTTSSSSIDAEIQLWSGLSAPSRTSNPVHVMEGLKKEYPQMYRLFRKFSIYPATQSKDERLFSMVGRNTGSLCQSIKVETLEKKVVVGSAIQKHGFKFHYKNGYVSSSSDNDDSL